MSRPPPPPSARPLPYKAPLAHVTVVRIRRIAIANGRRVWRAGHAVVAIALGRHSHAGLHAGAVLRIDAALRGILADWGSIWAPIRPFTLPRDPL